VELDQIRKIVELMQEHELSYFDMTTADGVHLRLKKGADLETLRNALSAAQFSPQTAAIPAAAAPVAPTAVASGRTPASVVGMPFAISIAGKGPAAPTASSDGEDFFPGRCQKVCEMGY
jgi:hypothetical protein